MYQKFMSRIEDEVKKLRSIVATLQAKDKERQWVKLQTHGDLDDTRIVEGESIDYIIPNDHPGIGCLLPQTEAPRKCL